MITPTVHLNGTSGGALLEQILKARAALDAALDAMREAEPNGRDFYPQGNNAINTAIAEHLARIKSVEGVLQQYDGLYEAVSKQLGA